MVLEKDKRLFSCMMQIEQNRKQEEQQRQALAIQQQIAAQQIQSNERLARLRLQNYIAQQQELTNQQHELQVGAYQNNSNNNIRCISRGQGRYVYTNCN